MFLKVKTIEDIKKLPENFNEPILFKNGCKSMPAINKWNLDYLKKKMQNILFPVEIYDNRDDMGSSLIKKQLEISFDKIIKKIKNDKPPYHYCAEIDLFEYEDYIHDDIFNDIQYEYDSIRTPKNSLIFVGKDTKSGCHIHGGEDYMLNQIFGRKIVYMFDFEDNSFLKMNSIFSRYANFKEDNFFKLDWNKLKIYKVELNPGDSLLIPPWWFHAVQGFNYSCSITKTFERTENNFLNKHFSIRLLNLSINYLDNFSLFCEDVYNNKDYISIFILGIIIMITIYKKISNN